MIDRLVPTDEQGYLDSDLLAVTGQQSDGALRSIYSRHYLESAPSSYGEDDCLAMVRAGLTSDQVYAIGVAHCRLMYTADPARKSGAGHPGDKALALAAVKVLEGVQRPLRRSRRRPKPN